MRTVIILAAAVGALLAASPGGAQSLADAARRAEEQHQRAGAGTPSFTDRDLTAGGLVEGNREAMSLTLTLSRLQQYAGARTAILRAMVQSPDLTRQIRSAVGRGARRGVDGLEQEYATIPAVVNAMQASQMSVHDYAVTEVAFLAAVGVLAGKLPLAGAPGTVGANVDFLKSHQQEVERLWRDATPLEQSLARQ